MTSRTPQSLPTSSGQDELREQIREISLTPINDIYFVPPGVSGSHMLDDDRLDKIMEAIAHHTQEAAARAKAEGKHEQRHQELGVSRWIAVGTEYDYWQHPMTIKKMHAELAAQPKQEHNHGE